MAHSRAGLPEGAARPSIHSAAAPRQLASQRQKVLAFVCPGSRTLRSRARRCDGARSARDHAVALATLAEVVRDVVRLQALTSSIVRVVTS
jgi:hypothetical protein